MLLISYMTIYRFHISIKWEIYCLCLFFLFDIHFGKPPKPLNRWGSVVLLQKTLKRRCKPLPYMRLVSIFTSKSRHLYDLVFDIEMIKLETLFDRQNSSGACFCFFCSCPSQISTEALFLFYLNPIGWDNKCSQFALKRLRNPQDKQAQSKVCLFNYLIFWGDLFLGAAI